MSRAIATRWQDRSPRRQQLVKRLIASGERIVLQALLHAAAGEDLDVVLESLCSVAPEDYLAANVATFPTFTLITGGRR